jgi:hypothetical protein
MCSGKHQKIMLFMFLRISSSNKFSTKLSIKDLMWFYPKIFSNLDVKKKLYLNFFKKEIVERRGRALHELRGDLEKLLQMKIKIRQ